MKTALSLILTLALTASALAQEDEEIRDNMWKLWRSTVAAPEADAADAGQQSEPEKPDESEPTPDAPQAHQQDAPHSPAKAKRPPAIPPLEPLRERLIPVQIAPDDQAEQAQADNSDNTSRPGTRPGPAPAEPSGTPGQQQQNSPDSERPDPTRTPPPVRLAADDEPSEDPGQDESKDGQEQGELPTGLEQFRTPPALIAALKLAQVSSANQVKDPAGLADRLYTRNLRRPAEYFYRAALVRQNDIDRAWVLLQLGNCLQDHDVASAGEQYATVLAEFPQSPWAKLAKVQQEICRYRLRHRDDSLTEDVLREVHQGTTDQLDELLKDLVKEDQP